MKKDNQFLVIIFLLSLLIIMNVSAVANSRQDSTPEQRAQRWNAWMKEELSLSTDQGDTVYEINLKYARLNEILKESDDDRRTKFRQLKSNDELKDQELKAVLSEAQFKHYQQKKKEFQRKVLASMRK